MENNKQNIVARKLRHFIKTKHFFSLKWELTSIWTYLWAWMKSCSIANLMSQNFCSLYSLIKSWPTRPMTTLSSSLMNASLSFSTFWQFLPLTEGVCFSSFISSVRSSSTGWPSVSFCSKARTTDSALFGCVSVWTNLWEKRKVYYIY